MKPRKDSIGMFWEDIPEVKIKKEIIKRTPPERTWEREDYLPHLQEALTFNYPLLTDRELTLSMVNNDVFILDTECYRNYFLVAMYGVNCKKYLILEQTSSQHIPIQKLNWVLQNFNIVTYNGREYDMTTLSACLAGEPVSTIKQISDAIIKQGFRSREIYKMYGIEQAPCHDNHIDLIELAPLKCSLKLLAGRMHSQVLQDLPFHPDSLLTPEQIAITKWYCILDLRHTLEFYERKQLELKLRGEISTAENINVMSASDQQIAELVLMKQIRKSKKGIKHPDIEPGKVYYYQPPYYMHFSTAPLQSLFHGICNFKFVVDELGKIPVPEEWGKELRTVTINQATYKLGIGGLHSSEVNQSFYSNESQTLLDWDVRSYYPRIVINNKYYPQHLGEPFLRAYTGIVQQRLQAAALGDKTKADALKITINGTFGKFASPYSRLYAPELLMQVTLTGQLSLLMLIEQLELNGIRVVSANTDGVTALIDNHLMDTARGIVRRWEHLTGFETEETKYKSLFNRDVNNYVAFKEGGTTKVKGVFVRGDLSKNPNADIIIDSVVKRLQHGTDPRANLYSCGDIKQFLFVRTVKGGAVKDGEYLGRVVRWYYSTTAQGEIIYALTGNKVPKTDNSAPCLVLPNTLPGDIDYERYLEEINGYLELWEI